MTRDDIVGSYAEQERAQRERAPLDLPNVAKLAEGYVDDAESEPAELPSGLLAEISDGELVIFCQWYALCDHVAVGTTSHPILGDVPICQRCADKHALPVDPFGAQS